MPSCRPAFAVLLATALLLSGAGVAVAADSGGATVTALSQFGNGTLTRPIRQSDKGLEVQLPGGTWIGCRTSCAETLRVETLDFWQAQARKTNECGLLGCLELRYPR